jgi:hypothetical protein
VDSKLKRNDLFEGDLGVDAELHQEGLDFGQISDRINRRSRER